MTAQSLRQLAIGLLFAVITLGSAACVPEPPRADPCGWMRSTNSPEPDTGRTVILVDTTNSTRMLAQHAGAPDFFGVLREHVEQAVERKDLVSVGSFSGPGAEPVWTALNQDANYTMENPDNQENRRETAITCLENALTKAVRSTPTTDGTDILSALRAAADRIRDGRAGKTIVVATDGLPTSGCADLTHANFDGDEEIRNITQVCTERAEVRPSDLQDVQLIMRGIGRPSVDQPAPSPAQLQWLEKLWHHLCRASGTLDEQCDITSGAVTSTSSTILPSAVTEVTDPPASFSSKTVTYEVPADILFDTNTAELRPEARSTLTRISVDIRTRKYSMVEVQGHTDSRASEQDNNTLGQRRADKVVDILSQNGLSNVVARSFGESRLKCLNEFPNGVEDPAALQCNRRVEIVVTLA